MWEWMVFITNPENDIATTTLIIYYTVGSICRIDSRDLFYLVREAT